MCLLSTCYVASSGQDPGGAACTETQGKEGAYHAQGAERKPLRPALLSEEENGLRLCALVAQSRMAIARQAPLPMDFFRQEYWSGLPFPSPGLTGKKDQVQIIWVILGSLDFILCVINLSIQAQKILSPHIAPVVHLTYLLRYFLILFLSYCLLLVVKSLSTDTWS